MKMYPYRILGITCVMALLLSGCATTTPPTSVNLPETWAASVAESSEASLDHWWHRFDSPQLEALIEESLQSSPDMVAVAEKVIQAEAQLRTTGASLFPSLNLSGNTAWNQNRSSEGRSSESESSRLSLGASYEVDIWGRMAADVRGSQASLDIAHYDLAAARLSLSAGVASAYFQTRAMRERVTIARENLAIAERVMAIVQARYRHGSASLLDVQRQESTVLSQRSSLLSLEEQEKQTASALALLLGRLPQHTVVSDETLPHLTIPTVAPGLPSELLVRRPDLARAEAQLAAAHASIESARAALLPSFSLSASAGTASVALLSLANPTTSLGLSAAIAQTIFDAGRRKNQIVIAESRQRELVETYRKTVLSALKEVEDALNRAHYAEHQATIQSAILEQTRRTLRLAEIRYREGNEEMLGVLDAQRSLFQAQDQVVQLRLARLNAALDLYKVLGGGWKNARPDEGSME
ncbi:efflux transporter outer membrane subunit [Chrysiogenes arsenatis]|uniref:efflux transporter outer membrane subunit n=1 Tax=Chrysiogenes arsenatis TaxID=309797 RepID=UPI0004212832|nr:efflux transporter outer membrane subunit [Chrysiogenes arsenatis]